jgi:4-hydroxybenzoate polyprenyltransferase
MSAWRFSLVGLLTAVTFAAVACGALVNPNEWWTVGVTTAAVALLAYAVLAAIYRQGTRRAFWLGLAVIGWGYFVLPGFAVGFKFENYGQLPLASSKLLQMLGEAGGLVARQLFWARERRSQGLGCA